MKKMFAAGSIAALLVVGLTGCSFSVSVGEDEPAGKAGGASAEVNSGESSDVEEAGGSVSEDGWTAVTFTGQGLEKGDDGEYPKFPVEIEAVVSNIEAASDAERAELLETANDSTKATLEAFDLWKVYVSERYVSGEDPAHQASYTSYKPVNGEGVVLNEVSAIGFDWCKSSSFKPEFVDGEINVSCLLTLVPKGGEAPAGVHFSQYGTESGENPVMISKQ